MTVDNRTSLSTEREYRLSSDTLFEVVTLPQAIAIRLRYKRPDLSGTRKRQNQDLNLRDQIKSYINLRDQIKIQISETQSLNQDI
jgi:hypothetical protein